MRALQDSTYYVFHIHRVKHLVGHSHPNIWNLLNTIQKEDVYSHTVIRLMQRGEVPRKRIRQGTLRHNQRLQSLTRDYATGNLDIEQHLRAAGHNIRFAL